MSLLMKSFQFKWLLSTLFVPPLHKSMSSTWTLKGPRIWLQSQIYKCNYQSNCMTFPSFKCFFYLTQQQSFLFLPRTCQCGSYDNREACQSSGSVQWGCREGGKQTEWGVRKIFNRNWSLHRILVNDEENKKEKETFGKDIDNKIIYFLTRVA